MQMHPSQIKHHVPPADPIPFHAETRMRGTAIHASEGDLRLESYGGEIGDGIEHL